MTIPEKTTTQAPADACKTSEFLLAAMRCGRIRVQLLQYGIDEIGIALRCNMITPEFAIGWLDHIGALDFINSDAWHKQVQE